MAHSKLIIWKFVIHVATNGFSRTVTIMNCSTDNQATTVFEHFLKATATYGLPQMIRNDGLL